MPLDTNKTAFLQWYQPLHSRLVRYCHSHAFGIMAAEDLVQEAVLATLANWENIKDRRKLLAYMLGVVNNLVRNHRRRSPFRGSLDEQRLYALQSALGDADTALDVHYLLRAIEELSPNQSEALRLFELSGFSVKEIAAIQNVSPNAVKTRLSRARSRLKDILSEDGRQLSVGERLRIYASIFL